jgi:cytochrome c551/c552
LLETRLLIYKDGQWNAATYQWNAAQDEALLLMDSASVHVSFLDSKGDERQTNYIIPSRKDCMACHRQGNQLLPIGPKIRNLNRIIGQDGDSIQQLVQLTKQGALELKSFKASNIYRVMMILPNRLQVVRELIWKSTVPIVTIRKDSLYDHAGSSL